MSAYAFCIAIPATPRPQEKESSSPDSPSGENACAAAPAIEAARSEARVFLDRAAHNLGALPDTPFRRSMLGLCDFVVQRDN